MIDMSFSKETIELPSYKEPTKGLLSYLPSSWVPYAELMRLNKPVGILNIYFPYLYGSLFAACVTQPVISPTSVLLANAKLFPMAFLLRSAGCTWNDIIDRDLDRQVTRCRLRPMAREAVSPRNGYTFFTAQILVWLSIVVQTDKPTIAYALFAVVLAQIYPFSKRVTDYAQVVLGIALAWGVLVGCMLQGVNPATLVVDEPWTAAALACVCLSYIIWSVIHDTVYAFQDIQDDAKAGVHTMTLRFKNAAHVLLSGLAVAQVCSHLATGLIIAGGFWYYSGTCFNTAALLAIMIWKVDLMDPEQCWYWFRYGSLIMGWTITAGLAGEYGQRLFAVK